MPKSAEPDSEITMLRAKVAALEHENGELRAAKRLYEQMSAIDGAQIRKLERQVLDAHGAASRSHNHHHSSRARE